MVTGNSSFSCDWIRRFPISDHAAGVETPPEQREDQHRKVGAGGHADGKDHQNRYVDPLRENPKRNRKHAYDDGRYPGDPDFLLAVNLAALRGRKLAILSNGSTDMLNALVRNSGLDRVLDATISIDSKKIFKPSPDAYTLIEEKLGVTPAEVLFVSSNPWDAIGAKSFGLNVAWIERVTPEAMALACVNSEMVAPLTMFKAIRMQMDELGFEPDYRIHTLSELPKVVGSL